MPRSRSYELIRSLVRSGLCSEVAGGRVARFRAAPPNEAIGRLEAFLAEQELRRKAALMTILSALDSRESGTGGPPGDEPVHMLRRTDRVYGAYDRLLSILHLTRPKLGSRQLESLLINHAGLGQTLQQAFDCLWEQATPFDEAVRQASGPGPAGIGPDPRERHQLVPRGRDGRFVGYD